MRDIIIQALKSSGKILMENFAKVNKFSVKENQSNIITKTDLMSERNIISLIESRFPDHSIIAEETGLREKKSKYLWIIDPIDGTSNFVSRIPWFGILICVLNNFEPVMAGIYLPFYDLLYFSEKGKGAYRNGQRIFVTKEADLKNILFSYSLDFSKDKSKTEFEGEIIKELVKNVRNLRSTNSVVDFCYTADGRLGGFINQTTKIWDISAPALIVQETGGVITDINGKPINFKVNKSNYSRNFTIIGSNRIIHRKVLKLIKNLKY